MKVSVLQQFLQNLILPLESSAASTQMIADLKRACQGFEPFGDKDVGEFAEFLSRAVAYERDGKWPSLNPPIAGRVVDEPSVRDYAHRLRAFLEREVPPGNAISDDVKGELERLAKHLKLPQIKEMARELQVEESFTKAKQGIEKIVFRLTGQNLSRKKTTASSRSKAVKTDPTAIQQYAAELRILANRAGIEQRLNELANKLTVPNLQALAEALGVTGGAKKKATLCEIILAALMARQTGETGTTSGAGGKEPPPGESKIARLVEIVSALKGKADGPEAPFDEIEAELRSLEGQMDRDEAISVAKRIGIIRHLNSRNEAVEEIRRKVFEMKRARESIAY